MDLELASFWVNDVVASAVTRWSDGILEVDVEELTHLARSDHRLADARIEIVRPGESARILPVHDVIEPRVKIHGSGVVYPGVSGRPRRTVGAGRTHRLGGVAVTECATLPGIAGVPGTEPQPSYYLDMVGPGAVKPYADLIHICVISRPIEELSPFERSDASWSATVRVADHLAQATRHCEPSSIRSFGVGECSPVLPGVVYLNFFYSPEHYAASADAFGTSIYGSTRLTPPWLLHPNELLDGAITRATMFTSSWLEVNNPVLHDLYEGHGADFCFRGVIAQRTRWTSQDEKEMSAWQAAKMASLLGGKGAIITWDSGGNDFVEVALTIQACEDAGIETVFITPDEAREGILASTLLFIPAEADAIVATGSLRVAESPPPERVVGFKEDELTGSQGSSFGPRPVYGQDDFYGWRCDSGFDY